MQKIEEAGFFSEKPYGHPDCIILGVRSGDKANYSALFVALEEVPDDWWIDKSVQLNVKPWNVAVGEIQRLKNLHGSIPIEIVLDSHGFYRSFNNGEPWKTPWIRDADRYWLPGSNPSTQPGN